MFGEVTENEQVITWVRLLFLCCVCWILRAGSGGDQELRDNVCLCDLKFGFWETKIKKTALLYTNPATCVVFSMRSPILL